MKRGFEENVPRVRPRVKLGRALDEQVAEAGTPPAAEPLPVEPPNVTALPDPISPPHEDPTGLETTQTAESPEPPIQAPRAAASRPFPAPNPGARASASTSSLNVDRGPAPETEPARRVPRRPPGPSVAEVTDLARQLTADLSRAAESNARLKSDLDAALAALRQAAEESRDQRADHVRLANELDQRSAELRALRGDLELLEAERDGALAQVARLSRELREEKSRGATAGEHAQAARAESAQLRETLQRLTAELHARVAERDATRAELLAARSERDRLAEELLAAHADAEAAAQSRKALEEIHKALSDARSRMSGIR